MGLVGLHLAHNHSDGFLLLKHSGHLAVLVTVDGAETLDKSLVLLPGHGPHASFWRSGVPLAVWCWNSST